jgi:hypothetical protein
MIRSSMDDPTDETRDNHRTSSCSSSLNSQSTILNDDLPSLEIVRQMITYETHLRLSDSVQNLLDLYHEDDNAITYVDQLNYSTNNR